MDHLPLLRRCLAEAYAAAASGIVGPTELNFTGLVIVFLCAVSMPLVCSILRASSCWLARMFLTASCGW
jgi:hypothetical protein